MSHYKQIVILVILLQFHANINCDKGNKTNRNATLERKTYSTLDKSADEYKITYKMAKSPAAKTTEFRDVGVSTEDQKFYGACPHFKENKLNIHDMVDVWQTVYYQAAEKVPCFKILIRTLSTIERKLNAQKYGSFENKVFWDNCTLEIKSDTTAMKHFLQETSLDHGILLNVIIEFGNATKLVNEGPDQWFVQKNLLLMKDCSSGDVVVFARVPFLPRKDVIMEGLKLTSDSTSGKYTCVDPASSSRDKDMEFEIFSDMNEFF